MKIVRDRVPALFPEHGYRVAGSGERAVLLRLKLVEETGEFLSAPTRRDRTEELADVYEVLEALREDEGISAEELEAARARKSSARGAFTEGWVLE